jgi:hypothetical protein
LTVRPAVDAIAMLWRHIVVAQLDARMQPLSRQRWRMRIAADGGRRYSGKQRGSSGTSASVLEAGQRRAHRHSGGAWREVEVVPSKE